MIDISQYGFLTRNYAAYYMTNLLSNTFLLSFYVVHALSKHMACHSVNGHNLTTHFNSVYRFGLIILAADAFNSAVPCIYWRNAHWQQVKNGDYRKGSKAMMIVSDVLEWFCRLVMLCVSILQHNVTHSKQSKYCTQQLGLL